MNDISDPLKPLPSYQLLLQEAAASYQQPSDEDIEKLCVAYFKDEVPDRDKLDTFFFDGKDRISRMFIKIMLGDAQVGSLIGMMMFCVVAAYKEQVEEDLESEKTRNAFQRKFDNINSFSFGDDGRCSIKYDEGDDDD